MDPRERLDELGRRIEQLTLRPEDIRAPISRLARPIFRAFGWRPTLSGDAVLALVAASVDELGQDTSRAQAWKPALEELEKNVEEVERATVVEDRPLVSYAAWLRRLWEVLHHAARLSEVPADEAEAARAVLGATATLAVLPPLAIAKNAPASGPGTRPLDSRLIDVELAAVDHLLLGAAMLETELLGPRQRLLEAARQLLLEASAALPLDSDGVLRRQDWLAGEISRVDRWVAAGIDPRVKIVHQARDALDRGDAQKLHACLSAIGAVAASAGDTVVAYTVHQALRGGWRPSRFGKPDPRASARRSVRQVFHEDFCDKVERSFETARTTHAELMQRVDSRVVHQRDAAREMLGEDAAERTLLAALASGGRFDVGGPLLPVRVIEEQIVARVVRHPTREMLLSPAQGPVDLPDAIIADPRSVLLDLAAGRLLTRRWIRQDVVRTTKTRSFGEVRVYVLDGSGSMIGPRARVRDAILLAELATLRERSKWSHARVVLYYRYFNDELEPVRRVDRAAAVDDAIDDVVATIRVGGTDIQAALVASLGHVRSARQQDPDLARAQIVLVTDGLAVIDEVALKQAREGLDDLPIGLSVIALGIENPVLRNVVARQRARGERAFYHFIPQPVLERMASGSLDDELRVHPPSGDAPPDLAAVRQLLEEMAALGRQRDLEALERLEAMRGAWTELDKPEPGGDGARARACALYRDARVLEALYARWLPSVDAALDEARDATVPAAEQGELDATLIALSTVAEVVDVVGGSPWERQARAITLLEQLLPDARLTPARYHRVIARFPSHTAGALRAVHAAVRPRAS